MQPKKEHKRKYAVVVGGIFIILAIIGAVTVAISSIRLTFDLLDNQRQKTTFEGILTPVVMFDPAPFEDPTSLDNQRLLLYSMWTTLSNEEEVLKFKRSEENNTLLVPASSVEVSNRKLFGDSVSLEHKSFSDNETTYFYNEELSSYEVPTSGYLYVYRPEVVEITKNEEAYNILVKYIPPDSAWSSIYKGEGGAFTDKKMIFVMQKVGKDWRLLAIRSEVEQEIYQGNSGPNIYDSNNPALGQSNQENAQATVVSDK